MEQAAYSADCTPWCLLSSDSFSNLLGDLMFNSVAGTFSVRSTPGGLDQIDGDDVQAFGSGTSFSLSMAHFATSFKTAHN